MIYDDSLVRVSRVGRTGRVAVLSLCLTVLLTTKILAGPVAGPLGNLSGFAAVFPPSIEIGQDAVVSLPENLTVKQRGPLLKSLYMRLRHASSRAAAKSVAEAIEQIWLTSGDDNIDFIMQNAILAMEEEDFVVAEELLDRVIELRPTYAEGWNKRAMVHFMKSEHKKAFGKLRQALALDPRHFQALHGLALVMQELGDNRGALQTYRVLLRNHPQFSEALEAVEELSRTVNGQDT